MILAEPELHFDVDDVVVPDIAGWRRERMPEIPVEKAYFTLAPDWVCEILSPSTEAIDRDDKLRIYAREGVMHVWFVNPIIRTLEGLRLSGERYELEAVHRDDAKIRAAPFEALEWDLSVLWQL